MGGGGTSSTVGGSSTAGSPSVGGSGLGGSSSGGSGAGGSGNVAGTPSTGGSGAPSNLPPATWETVTAVLDYGCFGGGCHDEEASPMHLNKPVSAMTYTQLTTHKIARCNNLPIVDKANPAKSGLVVILKEGCGPIPRMPPTCPKGDKFPDNTSCIEEEYVQAIENWIAAGFPQ